MLMTTDIINPKKPRAGAARIRCGYSLLEMMIALALLSALLAAGWSMLAIYRDAEQRGWRVVERTQSVRVAYSWLQNDLMHIAAPENSVQSQPTTEARTPTSPSATQGVNAGAGNRSAVQSRNFVAQSRNQQLLVGTSGGFTATITPSIDPVPFFERMLAGQQVEEDGGQANAMQLPGTSQSLGDDLPDAPVDKPLWPPQSVQVEYELALSSETIIGDEVVPIYDLVRRERVEQDQLQTEQSPWQSTEQVLTIDDLYRQSDASDRGNQALLQENRLPGLAKAEFWYCNGAQWQRSWNSSDRLPTAVALVFDFAPPGKPGAMPLASTDFTASPSDQLSQLNSLDSSAPTVDEPMLESSADGFELIERDVRLVVLLEQRSLAASPSNAATLSNPASGRVGGQP
jgi:prepilin-type N-terminal cleavage/methylation domain-containing protein